MSSRLTVLDFPRFKAERRPIVCVTAYDYTFARLLDDAGVDLLLVGDSLGMVVQGHDTTLPVTLDHMIYHTQAVVRGSRKAFVACDLPFGLCHRAPDVVLEASIRVLKESGAQAVKVEGGVPVAEAIRALTTRHIPVLAHVGLTPQSVHAFGGFKVQGRGEAADKVLADAIAVEQAGAFAVVLEGIPARLARKISERLTIPTIGIGAGPGCDGQVLVVYDLLGFYDGIKPKFVKRYLEGSQLVRQAVHQFADEVRNRSFPVDEHCFSE
ncbi:MAG: 3-methyl-2-oxobutanoate hydroxymethyltransferase [Magnetococcales bacterium]|nr:3-methyl-2-oxobutanoate hydroxymethyltransferase [Magnetococcales bacterium]MBF0148702.1 3-methyl-2-oxobutanoate hydroxymethyltransferase [Magnetococcales bacterium]MBF0173389.1 3-methyl-2-oxobutanoate hydroxymethyltransferase [Magnetococcales bacterium]MBF0630250.1 3-methyl-2-oxobutanoate hydroxymethyltransferase [Magnetococcales bacterium]